VAGLAEHVNLSSKELPLGESEVELTGLSVSPSVKVKTPRLKESPVNLECVLRQVLVFGEGPRSANLVIGEVVLMHVADSVLDEDGRVDPSKLATIGRLGGDYYCRTTDTFRMKRP
jgi:flavin reductase (DIM6/NTAB) family NADH-FMN oxidoreductase RutF